MRERRQYPRIDFELKLKVFHDEGLTRIRANDCVVSNISKVGLSFVSHETFDIGQQFYMRFDLMGGLQVIFLGEICWKKGTHMLYTYGVRYVKLGWLSQRNLQKGLLSQYFPEEKSKMLLILECILLVLLVILLSRFLNKMPLAYTVGVFLTILGVFYFIMLRSR